MSQIRSHWKKIYTEKREEDMSWTQEVPQPSLDLILALDLPFDAPIIDIGGGNSKLAESLLDRGYTDITVVDISEEALSISQKRMGTEASKITWTAANILNFSTDRQYACWHDRAVFHFFTEEEDKLQYKSVLDKYCSQDLIIGTFSTSGPTKCSGLTIQQYDVQSLSDFLSPEFLVRSSLSLTHCTPFDTYQDFIFCTLEKNISL